MFLKLDEETKHTLEEISALSGIQRDVIREVWEFTLIRWIEQITRDPVKLNRIQVPFLGTVGVRYVDDQLAEDGSIALRAYVEEKTAAAKRLHYWMSPSKQITLERVVSHDDVQP